MTKRSPAGRPPPGTPSAKRPATRPPPGKAPERAAKAPAATSTAAKKPAAKPTGAKPPAAKPAGGKAKAPAAKPAPGRDGVMRYTMWSLPLDDLKPMQPRLAAVLQETPGVEEAHVVGVRPEGQDMPKATLVLVLNNRASEDDVVQRLLPKLAPALPRDTKLDLVPVRVGEELLEWARKARGLVFRRTR